MNENSKKLVRRLGLWMLAVALSAPAVSRADARTDYLLMMLERGGNYRIRVQAATSLGQLRCEEAVPALSKALTDTEELVVISAATALAQIGDVSVIGAMEDAAKKTKSSAARSQLEASLRVLKALSPEGDTTAADAARKEFLIRVDKMGNSSGHSRADITEQLREVVLARLAREPGVIMQPGGLDSAAVKGRLKKEKLRGYIISGSVVRMEHVGDKVIVKIGLNVFSNPDYSLLMMPTAEGAVTVSAEPLARETERAAQDQAVKMVAESLVGSVFKTLRQSDGL